MSISYIKYLHNMKHDKKKMNSSLFTFEETKSLFLKNNIGTNLSHIFITICYFQLFNHSWLLQDFEFFFANCFFEIILNLAFAKSFNLCLERQKYLFITITCANSVFVNKTCCARTRIASLCVNACLSAYVKLSTIAFIYIY